MDPMGYSKMGVPLQRFPELEQRDRTFIPCVSQSVDVGHPKKGV